MSKEASQVWLVCFGAASLSEDQKMPLIFSFICLSKTGDPLSSITAGILQDGALPPPCTSEETNGAKTMVFPF